MVAVQSISFSLSLIIKKMTWAEVLYMLSWTKWERPKIELGADQSRRLLSLQRFLAHHWVMNTSFNLLWPNVKKEFLLHLPTWFAWIQILSIMALFISLPLISSLQQFIFGQMLLLMRNIKGAFHGTKSNSKQDPKGFSGRKNMSHCWSLSAMWEIAWDRSVLVAHPKAILVGYAEIPCSHFFYSALIRGEQKQVLLCN